MDKINAGLLSSVLLLTACSSDEAFFEEVNADTGHAHVHGMDYVDGELMIATHYGLLKKEDDTWLHSTANNHDYMGFTAYGEGFYASGHPEPSTDLENPLGLVKSTDQGETLEQLVFSGETDYHYMSVSKNTGRLYTALMHGNSELEPGFYYTDDEGNEWSPMALSGLEAESIFGLAAHPDNLEQVAILTNRGIYESTDAGKSVTLLQETEGASAAMYTEDPLYTVQNQTFMSQDEKLGDIPLEEPVLYLAVNPSDLEMIYAVTGDGEAAVTEDGGVSWSAEEIIPSE
ncbi:F510_1955 family glycosylhydrolase [Jeotgalibacillus sp. JSM ZJ347]|uniref:F510_1955 family glycosylhydrolase n=1 Tax=Jeotgalibacillus sp. JSM ZJ347 TaxID=3342117 RepID=UPI0035A85B52